MPGRNLNDVAVVFRFGLFHFLLIKTYNQMVKWVDSQRFISGLYMHNLYNYNNGKKIITQSLPELE